MVIHCCNNWPYETRCFHVGEIRDIEHVSGEMYIVTCSMYLSHDSYIILSITTVVSVYLDTFCVSNIIWYVTIFLPNKASTHIYTYAVLKHCRGNEHPLSTLLHWGNSIKRKLLCGDSYIAIIYTNYVLIIV